MSTLSNTKKGFTLIEVLVALMIISIAILAIIKISAQNIKTTSYLQEKTSALFLSKKIISEVQAGILRLSSTVPIEGKEIVLGAPLHYYAYATKTENPHIEEIKVSALNDRQAKLVTLIGYRYVSEEE